MSERRLKQSYFVFLQVSSSASHLLLLLLLVVVLLLLALWYQVVQPAQLSLGEAEIQKLPDEDQSQDLQRMNGADKLFCSIHNKRCSVSVVSLFLSHHHGEDDGSGRGLDGPEDDEAGQLHHSEDVDLPQRDVAQVDEVRLVFGRHAEQFDPVEQLQRDREVKDTETQR